MTATSYSPRMRRPEGDTALSQEARLILAEDVADRARRLLMALARSDLDLT